MKILHVITSLRTGGAEKLMVDLLPRLKDLGHDVDLLLFDGTDTAFRRAVEASGVKVMDLGKGGSVYSLKRLFKLLPYLRKYDVVHTHNTAPQLFAAMCSLLSSTVLCTTEHSTTNRRRKMKWFAAVDRWMYRRYSRVICISQKTEHHLRNYIGSTSVRISTVSNGIDVERFSNSSPMPIKVSECETALIQVAGFRYQKDQDTVIRSLALLPSSIHLYLVGDGERRNDLLHLVEELGLMDRAHFLGIRSDVPELLKAADIVVMSSHCEGFGLAAVEGMAAGRPVVASDVDGLREVVEGAGLLFPPGDSGALAEAVKSLVCSSVKYREVASACIERASEYDISRMAEGYSSIYNSLHEKD